MIHEAAIEIHCTSETIKSPEGHVYYKHTRVQHKHNSFRAEEATFLLIVLYMLYTATTYKRYNKYLLDYNHIKDSSLNDKD